jgi:hypothetical protein
LVEVSLYGSLYLSIGGGFFAILIFIVLLL